VCSIFLVRCVNFCIIYRREQAGEAVPLQQQINSNPAAGTSRASTAAASTAGNGLPMVYSDSGQGADRQMQMVCIYLDQPSLCTVNFSLMHINIYNNHCKKYCLEFLNQ